MQKIPTLLLRDESDRKYVTRVVNPEAAWVFSGIGTPTYKWDGTCVMFDGAEWWARRELKPNQPPPENFVPIVTDTITGKTQGWVPARESGFIKFLDEATSGKVYPPGTYELTGPKINGNPHEAPSHRIDKHGDDVVRGLIGVVDLDKIVSFVSSLPENLAEGIVWHSPDGRMAKLKRRDIKE